VLFLLLPVEAGYGWLWLFSIGSKQWFCPYKALFITLKKNNAPL
jgi:hypothetical protein